MDVIHSEEWTPWCKKGGQTFTQKKRPRNKNTEVFQTHGRQRTLLPLIEVVLLCTFVSFSIFILKVCYLKRALAGEGWGGGRGFMMGWGQRSRGWQRSNRSKGRQPHFWTLVLAAESSIGHQMTSCPWPEVTQDSSTAWDHLLIKCVSTHEKNVLFLFVHTHFFPSSFFLAFLHIFWEICGFKMAGQTWVPPAGHFLWLRGRQGLWQHYRKTTWPFVCVFVCVRAHVCVYVWLSVLGCAGVSSCTQVYCTIQLPLFATVEN